MTDYMHHIPGRLRIRSKIFRGESAIRGSILSQLKAVDGVFSVRLNHKAACVTLWYAPDSQAPDDIMRLLNDYRYQPTPLLAQGAEKPKTTGKIHRGITREISKIAFNVLVSRGVSYSLSSLLGSRI